MEEFVIELNGTHRADGSVLVYSESLPLFSAVGENEEAAFKLALDLLPEYCRRNVPEFVDLRSVPNVRDCFVQEHTVFPAYQIAQIGGGCGRAEAA